MPLLKAKLALNGMQASQVLKVVATDPGSERDFHMFAEHSDHQILDFRKDRARLLLLDTKKGEADESRR